MRACPRSPSRPPISSSTWPKPKIAEEIDALRAEIEIVKAEFAAPQDDAEMEGED